MDIIGCEECSLAKGKINDEVSKVISYGEGNEYDNLFVMIYTSKYRIGGHIASVLSSVYSNKTVLAINRYDKSLSLRGDLALYYKDILMKNLDYIEVGGHPGYAGGKLTKLDRFLNDLDHIIRGY